MALGAVTALNSQFKVPGSSAVLVVDNRPEMRSLFRYFIEEAGGRFDS
jgi:hypothetical protein